MHNTRRTEPSSHHMDAAQLQRVQSNPAILQDILGLPPSSNGVTYTVYERQPLPGQTPVIYQSSVGTVTTQSGTASVGAGTQSIVTNSSQWTPAVPVRSVTTK